MKAQDIWKAVQKRYGLTETQLRNSAALDDNTKLARKVTAYLLGIFFGDFDHGRTTVKLNCSVDFVKKAIALAGNPNPDGKAFLAEVHKITGTPAPTVASGDATTTDVVAAEELKPTEKPPEPGEFLLGMAEELSHLAREYIWANKLKRNVAYAIKVLSHVGNEAFQLPAADLGALFHRGTETILRILEESRADILMAGQFRTDVTRVMERHRMLYGESKPAETESA